MGLENVVTKEVEGEFPVDHQSANSLTASHTAPCESGPKVVECDQTPVLATFIMLHREEVRRPLTTVIEASSASSYKMRHNDGNRIGCSVGAVFARRRGLGLSTLPRLARSKWQNVCASAARTDKKGPAKPHCAHHEWVSASATSR